MKRHIFELDGKYCMVDGDAGEVYSLQEELYVKLKEGHLTLNQIDEFFKKSEKPIEIIKEERNLKCNRLTINITNKCNLACRYCYANCGDYKQDSNPEITTETVKNAIRAAVELYPEGITMIQLFGGEPLILRNNLDKIVSEIKMVCEEINIPTPLLGLVTNGTLINEEVAQFIVNNIKSLTISLDGSESVNDFNRRFAVNLGDSVYKRVKNAVKLLKKYNKDFHVRCECTVTAKNIRDYVESGKEDNLYNAIYNDIGFDSCLCNPVFGCDDPEISLENVDRDLIYEYFDKFICREIHNSKGELKDIGHLKRTIEVLKKKKITNKTCGANTSDLCVDVKGDLYTCFMFIGEEKYKVANVNQWDINNLKERFTNILEELEQANDNEVCNNCWAQRFCSTSCGNCIGARYLGNGSVKAPIEMSCEIGKKSMERFIWEAIRYKERK